MPGIPEITPYSMPVSSQLPANVAHWKIDSRRSVLLIHDMQKYFVRRFPEHPRITLLENTALICKRARNLGVPILFTGQTGDMTENQRGLLKDFWGNGMKADPSDRQIVEELKPAQEDWLFTKWRYSAFHKSDLLQRMRDENRDQLIICGVYAHVGVLMTAVDAFSNDIETFIVADAIADFSQDRHFMALDYAARCCAVVMLAQKVMI